MTRSSERASPAPVRRGRPPKTSREDLVEAALHIADSEGLSTLSMRRLADELGVAVTTLYNHVSGKEDLIALLRQRTLNALYVDTLTSRDWREQLFDGLTGVYDAFSRHPSAVDLLYSQPAIIEPALRAVLDPLVATLEQAGFSTERAIDTLGTLQLYVTAMAGHERLQARRRRELAQIEATIGETDAVVHSRAWARSAPSDTFRVGLEGLIAALSDAYAGVGHS